MSKEQQGGKCGRGGFAYRPIASLMRGSGRSVFDWQLLNAELAVSRAHAPAL